MVLNSASLRVEFRVRGFPHPLPVVERGPGRLPAQREFLGRPQCGQIGTRTQKCMEDSSVPAASVRVARGTAWPRRR